MNWRLLVVESIAKIAKLRNPLFFRRLCTFWGFGVKGLWVNIYVNIVVRPFTSSAAPTLKVCKKNIYSLHSHYKHQYFGATTFSLNRQTWPIQYRVAMSVCLCVTSQKLSSGVRGDLWSKNVFLILGCDDTIFKKKIATVLSLMEPFFIV